MFRPGIVVVTVLAFSSAPAEVVFDERFERRVPFESAHHDGFRRRRLERRHLEQRWDGNQ